MPSSLHRFVASTLAARLAHCAWTPQAVTRQVRSFLPKRLQRDAAPLSEAMIAQFPQKYSPDADRLIAALLERPEILRVFKHCTKSGTWPTHSVAPTRMRPVPPFDALNLPALHTMADLAEWLFLTPEQLEAYIDKNGWREAHPMPGVNNYFYRHSPKAGGGVRLIEAPKPRLKTLQRLILRHILTQVPSHPDAFGFVRGRDCRGAAQRHAGEEVVIAFDLKNYFGSVNYGRIYALFRHLGYPASVAASLSGICTVVTPSRIRMRLPYDQRQALMVPHLPQGAPSSPSLANLVTYRLDKRLAGLARSLGANYTRYADDFTFSGDCAVRQSILGAVPDIVREEGFELNTRKTRVMSKHQRQMVTGIVVNETLNVSRTDFDLLKAMIHQRAWQDDPAALARLVGKVGWVAQVNASKGQKLYTLLERALAKTSGPR